MAPGKTEASSKRADSRSPDRNLARFYCNPWPNILDVPGKNKHPTGTWTTKFPPVKVIVQNHRIQSAASNHLIAFILQFFQPALARTLVNSVTGQTNVNVSQCQRVFLGCFKLLLCWTTCEDEWQTNFQSHSTFWSWSLGERSKFANETRELWTSDDTEDFITPRGLPLRLYDKGKPIQPCWAKPIRGPTALSPLKKLM